MDGVDLRQFQFDFDMSWAGVFLNADGTIYARYGTRSIDGPMALNSMEGLMSTMTRVLEAHEKYPANRELFTSKLGPKTRYERPELYPKFSGGRGGCIHCHQVHEAMHHAELAESPSGTLRVESVYKYPMPESLGISVDPTSGTRVTASRVDAVRRGGVPVRPGDIIESLGGQAILSVADIQFVLHHAKSGELPVTFRRGEERVKSAFRLSGHWRRTDFTWRASLKDYPPSPGIYVASLRATERRELGLGGDRLALEVRGLFGPAVKRSGLKRGDVIVRCDGSTEALTAPAFDDHVRLHHFLPGSVLELRVLREGKSLDIDVKF